MEKILTFNDTRVGVVVWLLKPRLEAIVGREFPAKPLGFYKLQSVQEREESDWRVVLEIVAKYDAMAEEIKDLPFDMLWSLKSLQDAARAPAIAFEVVQRTTDRVEVIARCKSCTPEIEVCFQKLLAGINQEGETGTGKVRRSTKKTTQQVPQVKRPTEPVQVFFSYAHEDEDLRDQLEKHLSALKRQGVITGWHDRKIGAGKEWEGEIDAHLNVARVVLLLVSSDFMASDYCWDVEVKRAMERHGSGEARVIPVILRPVDWMDAPFGKLQALPRDAKAVTSWVNRDEAFLDVARGIRAAVEELVASEARIERSHGSQAPTVSACGATLSGTKTFVGESTWRFFFGGNLQQGVTSPISLSSSRSPGTIIVNGIQRPISEFRFDR